MQTISSFSSYQSIKHKISDLDLIFFKGEEFVSKAIMTIEQLVTGHNEWSHVGLVISRKNLNIHINKNEPIDTLYLWESTFSSNNPLLTADTTVDVESNSGVFGVQIRKLDDVINNTLKNKAGVGWGKLINNPLDDKVVDSDRKSIQDKLNKLHIKYYHKSYPTNVCSLLRALFTCCTCVPPNNRKTVFCSQFVSIVYKNLGIIDNKCITGEVIPVDLSSGHLGSYSENAVKIVEDVVNLTE